MPLLRVLLWLLQALPVDGTELREEADRHPPGSPARLACLEAWASTHPPPERVAQAPSDAQAAIARAQGGVRLLGRLEGGVLTVRLLDPLEVVGRVRAHRVDDQKPLPKRSRLQFVWPSDAHTVEVEAFARACRDDVVIARTRIEGPAASIAPPPPPVATATSVEVVTTTTQAPAEGVPAWWWYTLLGVAAAGIGLAVLQETRD